MAENAFDAGHLIGHVKDAEYFEVPRCLDFADGDGRLFIPQFRESAEPIYQFKVGHEAFNQMIEPLNGRLTKFMVLEVVVAVLISVIFIWLAQKISSGLRPRGRLWNLLEMILLFLRDQVARPAIGKHDADRFLPFIWTIFFFILGCNLMGMLPWAGSPTGALAVTGSIALITFATVIGSGMAKLGPIGFWLSQIPPMDLPPVLAILLKPMIFSIEVMGLFIKHFVLAVRLLANMFAGHLVLAVLVTFIGAIGGAVSTYYHPLFLGVTVASVGGAVALSLLELFVAFLQAYIFAFLSALFIGMAVHPH